MTTKYHQISLKESFSDCQDQFIDDAPSFFLLLSEHCDINEFIPIQFSNAFYQTLGRNRIYPLHGFLSAFIFAENLLYSYRFATAFTTKYLQGIARFLWFFKGS